MKTRVTLLALLALLASGMTLLADPPPQSVHGRGRSAAVKRQFVGGGHWRSGQRPDDRRNWQVQIRHDEDDSISGRILIVGSPVLEQAQIDGQISGNDVFGVLLDGTGAQVGTFEGSIAGQSLRGTYHTADGDSGDWGWDGPLPE